MRVTINKINAKANKLGYEIVRGNGYFYFSPVGEYPMLWQSSVYVFHLSSCSVNGWIDQLKGLINNSGLELSNFDEQCVRASKGLKPKPIDPGPIKIAYRKNV